ncbi:MAG: prolyl oligopeptidase family serine peptidase [Tenuifilaceae bacterium]|jgi:dipeptidyl aminopeptidase/acylaminoacyl peptidase|nr:prolyl oligopeptidase family serine peptidase [Tenuifilaceae bacterium]
MRRTVHKTICLVFILLFSGIIVFASGNGNRLTPEHLFDIESVAEVVLSPSKLLIAYTLNVPRPLDHKPGGDYRELHVINLKTNQVDKLITGEQSIFSITWSLDGNAIIYRANRPDAPGTQIYKMDVRTKSEELVFKHDASISQYQMLPNGILFTSLAAEDPARTEFRAKGYNIEIFEEEWRHINLYLHDFPSGQTRQLTSDVTVYDFVASPDGKRVAAAISPKNLVDYSYMFQRIHIIDVATGYATQLVDNPGKLGNLVWSPDGKKLAFRSASKLEDSVVGSLYVVDVPNSKKFVELRNYAERLEMSIIDMAWKDNSTLLYAAEEGVDIVLSEQKLNAKARTTLSQPGEVVFRRFQHIDGVVAFAGHTAMHPAEAFTFNLKGKKLERITQHNPWLANVELAKQTKLEYNARDGKRIEGVLVYPVDFEEGKSYPLITYIHGGPEAAVQNGWTTNYSTWSQFAAARNFFVFLPNYRASSGRGVDFTMAGYADLVGVEYDDVLDGIDHLINIGYVDKTKVGIGGGSYGGYFSAWSATKHTERFAASVVFVGISNQVSKRNTTDIPLEDYHVHWGFWNHENFEKVWGASPIKYAHQSKTPTLILHGTNDPRIHPEQGLQLYRALKLHGQAPVRLVWYPGEGHGNRINLNRYDYLIRTLEWFEYYLISDNQKDSIPGKY